MYPIKVLFGFGIPLHATLSQVIQSRHWSWPAVRPMEMLDIQKALIHSPPTNQHDAIIWKPSNSELFHLEATWNAIRVVHAKVSWYPLIWFKN